MDLTDRAPAKVNLSLRVHGRRADGFHALDSLVAFAEIGDTLTLTPDAALRLDVESPFAGDLDSDNIVLRAAEAVADLWPEARTGAFRLVKRLPVAAGLGGGSSDAAAALRLLAGINPGRITPGDLERLAASLGSDVPVCLEARAAWVRGRGERVTPLPELPPVPAVLANPGTALATGEVYAALGAAPVSDGTEEEAPLPGPFDTLGELVAFLARERNDLEEPARALAPVIGETRAALEAAPGCLLARLSGSGATCFGIFAEDDAARQAARDIAAAHPEWWVVATRLG